ncbi:hypothetical protein QTI66_32635 [Variovorax sp. J22R133]|uniref:gp33 family protein n=1 Tax=Variovorax brevis TaxID=3053503 RepID=UPI0025766734|nr:hypothetical protein [Variovorax sp. J22R133]MDM0116875.1 hypothetical protein [Variovorax sp. J22R133]
MDAVVEERNKRAAKRLRGEPTIGGSIDWMWKLREKKRDLETETKKIEDEIASIEERLMTEMKAQGMDKASGSKASVSITSTVVANVIDWDAFHAYIHKNKAGHLLQRRVADPAWRELTKDGLKPLPGTEAFTKRRLNLRSNSGAA